MSTEAKVGILVGGGPAPGINGVISAVTIAARRKNLDVIGFYDGYKWLAKGNSKELRKNSVPLRMNQVSRIHFEGGSILRTSRTNPKKVENGVRNSVNLLKELGVTHLVTIGGDDTVSGAWTISEQARKQGVNIKFAHVPKTIDNDLPLPEDINTFGFATACHEGAVLLKNIMHDSKTSNRWMMAVTMGRHTGHLALGIAKAAGATLAIIPEEFTDHTSISDICDIIEGAMIKRKVMGHENGVVVVAEGLSEIFSDEEILKIPGAKIKRDPYGNRRLADVDLGKGIKMELEKRYSDRRQEMRLVFVELGYLLRCADPIPQDQIYTRDLGYSAIHYLFSEDPAHQNNAIICIKDGELHPLPFDSIIDPHAGKAKIRHVNVHSYTFKIAQEYMLRLTDRDLQEQKFLENMATEVNITPEEFCQKYQHTIFRNE